MAYDIFKEHLLQRHLSFLILVRENGDGYITYVRVAYVYETDNIDHIQGAMQFLSCDLQQPTIGPPLSRM